MPKRDLNQAVARNLRRLRQKAGHSQDAFGDLCGLHRTYVGAIEREERNITLQTLEQLARALKVDPVALLKQPDR